MIFPLRMANLLFIAIVYIAVAPNQAQVQTTANPVIKPYVCPSFYEVATGQCRGLHARDQMLHTSTGLDEPNKMCKADDSTAILPIVRNAEDDAYWRSLASARNVRIPLGIKCNTFTKKWVWSDGSSIDYKPPKSEDELNKPCITDAIWTYMNNFDYWMMYQYNNIIQCDVYCTTEIKKAEIRIDDCLDFDRTGNTCFKVSKDLETWSDAQDKCKTVGASLASIHSIDENSFVRRLAVSQGLVNGMHLGATGKNNKFAWTDGSEWNYTHFLPGFPMDNFGDCVMMSTGDVDGEWANSACTAKFPYVCERKPFTGTPTEICRGADIKEGDFVVTPGFPMDASMYCDFFLGVDQGKVVEIEVLLIEANNCCDHFVLYEVLGSGYNVIANVTGASSGKKYRTKTSNLMRASWQPNGAVNVRGVMFTFRAV